jgi:GWxTD domain-containing protein
MKNLIFISLFLVSTHLSAINIELSSYNFYSNQPYTEIYLRMDGNSVTWKEEADTKSASVNILVIITSNNGNIEAYDKFTLTASVTDSISDFIEVKRFGLAAGEYLIKMEAEDILTPSNKIEIQQKLIVDKSQTPFFISDILPLSKIKKDSTSNPLVKNGYYMEPLSYHYSGSGQQQLDFYFEIYKNLTASGDYFIQYSIMEGNTQNLNAKPILSKYKKIGSQEIQPEVLSLPVNGLKSGDYHLAINIINKDKNVLSSRTTDLTKSNPEADIAYLENYNQTPEHSFVQNIQADEMDFTLKAHLPITDQHQVSTLGELMKTNRIKSQRQFIYQLWKSKAPSNPAESFKGYMEVAAAVDKKFYTNVGYGFQSDRGHIFLKYGKPSNIITVDTEVDAPPYEIWYYNNMPQTRQTNVRFLFYNPTLAHNDFRLLHSTCLGEKVNPAWEVELYKSVPMERQGNTVDATQIGENWNRNARRYFNEY